MESERKNTSSRAPNFWINLRLYDIIVYNNYGSNYWVTMNNDCKRLVKIKKNEVITK